MKPAFITRQLRTLARMFVTIYLPVMAVLFGLLLFCRSQGISFGILSRDPLAIVEAPFYYGIISNVGMIVWSFAAAINIFSFFILRSFHRQSSYFFLAAGIITLMLLFDDFFLLHEEVFPDYLHISEVYMMFVYGMSVLFYLFRYREYIKQTKYLYFLMAFVFLGFSVVVDVLPDALNISIPEEYFMEDGSKFLGIISWLIYFADTSLQEFTQLLGSQKADAYQEDKVIF